jgi:hypothetical protein
MGNAGPARWRAALGQVFRGRPVICAPAPLAGHTDTVRMLLGVGARRPLVLADGLGAGPGPGDDEAEVVQVRSPRTATVTASGRKADAFWRTGLPERALAAVERYDPRREGLWLAGPFVDPAPLHGRPVAGGRPASWVALEDKTVADALWDAVGVSRAPSLVVPCDHTRLTQAAAELDEGSGTVWAGDARDGINGAGEYVRWVVTREDAARALAHFAVSCDRVRVMPFLDGIPCSIHGCVLPDGVAAFRPVELAILRTPGRRFVYGGLGSTWDPPGSDREAMRRLVRRVGEHLAARVGYRGFFGVDGVLTADGFRPTELNPRMSAGIAQLGRAADPALFGLLQATAVLGVPPPMAASALEDWAVATMDARRFCRPVAVSSTRLDEKPLDLPVALVDRELHGADERSGLSVQAGPNPAGTYVRLMVDQPVPGQRVAELNAALMRFLDAELGTSFGDVVPAPDLRRH